MIRSLRYGRESGYDAAAFWDDQHRRYGSDFRAVADHLEDGATRYPAQRQAFLTFLEEQRIALRGVSCIELGCGNGFWANVVLTAGAASYRGFDISPTAVRHCRTAIPAATFDCVDLSRETLPSSAQADLVFSIDVLQHVVELPLLERFLDNMRSAVKPDGWIVLTSYIGYGDQFNTPAEDVGVLGLRVPKVRWVHAWDVPTLNRLLAPYTLVAQAPFWDKTILAFRRVR
jgi:SAM-dependent methyltransferase